MTFGVVASEEPLVAELIALAFESAGHVGLVFEDLRHATRVLQELHVDLIVLDMDPPDGSGLEWLETMATEWPDLSSRTLLLSRTSLSPEEAARVGKLRVEVVHTPFSLVAVERVVTGQLQKAGFEPYAPESLGWKRDPRAEFVN
ncbi:MAG TPA: response regulator [Candidatus Polarisedimenticolaceae bacterium]